MSAAAEFPWMPSDAGQQARSDLRLLFERADLGAAKFEPSGNIILLNSALERLLGVSPRVGQARSLCLADIVPAESSQEVQRLLQELFDGKRDSFSLETKVVGQRGRTLRWTAWRVAGGEGGPDYALAVAQDATASHSAHEQAIDECVATSLTGVRAIGLTDEEEVSRIEQRMRHAEKLEAMGRLAGGVAHDFNNVLTGVLMYCDLLLASFDAGHAVRKYAEEIRSAGFQATGLVQQLMAISRPRNAAPGLISLNETIGGMRTLLARLIGENIALRFQLDPGLGLIKMDPTQAQQVLLNLVLNARDAMPAGGEITVETSNCRVQIVGGLRDGSSQNASSSAEATPDTLPCALFVVGDDGSGMDAETRAHLFEAFYTTKSDGRGTGLGLATVYQIVTTNGGLIHVASAPGRGTRISVLLPLAPQPDSQTINSQTAQSQTMHEIQPKTNEGALP